MLDIILAVFAIAAAQDDAGAAASVATTPALVAEPQTPTGKFTTATEVKPILSATKANWIAVRDYGGQDLIYVTHLWAWRCGLVGMAVAVNDGAPQDWPLPDCHTDTATPNAILQSDGVPYRAHPRGSVQSVTVTLTYDDLSVASARFTRAEVLIP
ncbi:hypothetical protein KDD17_08920 [Sulfitobacter albidus]|uniref:Uncharacterized protein n=1 Tax=Sulfitobacter albidus TaxID=2829501 RepID=A0A975JB27_9RHOB|nr:hypothetical protein [Sulfitobacter albidus]QUJ75151.1 hypothetical protein KDD17_08920 [Sulfitobacter albidus]